MPQRQVRAWECNRCHHVWVARSKRKPLTCPKCRSAYWDEPRRRAR